MRGLKLTHHRIVLLLCAALLLAGCTTASIEHSRETKRGQEAAALGRYQTAIRHLLPLLAADRSNVDLNRALGICYFFEGRYAVARQLLERSLTVQPSDPATVYFLAAAEDALGQTAAARYAQYRRIAGAHRGRAQVTARERIRARSVQKARAREIVQRDTTTVPVAVAAHTVAIGTFRFIGADETTRALQKGLSYLVSRDLALIAPLVLTDRERALALLEAMGLGQGGAASPEQAARLTRLLGVRYYLGGTITALGPTDVRIDPAVTDQTTGATTALPDLTATPADLFSQKTALVRSFLEAMDVPVTESIQSIIAGSPTRDYEAFLAFSLGLDLEDRGLFAAASAAYREAVDRDGAFYAARLRASQMVEVERMGVETLLRVDGPAAQVLLDERVFPRLPDAQRIARLQAIGALTGAGMASGTDERQPVEERREAERRRGAAMLPGPPVP